ncbi:MAG: glycoside hydrolase [Clostridia bacterium]|nr:glycoside hydrolase [Clostridia bacterium]
MPDDTPVVDTAVSFGVAPVLLLSTLGPDGTFDSRLASMLFDDPAATENLILQLLSVMKDKGYRGIDVDFEYILPEDKDRYSAFIALLTERMNAEGLEVMVALAPKTAPDQKGLLYEGHDYAALGRNANALLLMTYEWGYAFGPPGAIAPINKVEEVIDYALSEIPADKIFLGIPNYGYDWTLPFTPGQGRAKTISPGQAVELAAKYRAEILYDPQTASPYFYYTAEDGKRHAVHFEDVRSYREKFRLLARKGLAGLSVWTVMNDTPPLFLLANSLFEIL